MHMKRSKNCLIVTLLAVIAVALSIALLPLLTATPVHAAGEGFSGGDGKTEETAYRISNLTDLETFCSYVNEGRANSAGEYFRLTENIDMSSKYKEGGQSWTPIGTGTHKFSGTFDGDDHTISGLYIDSTEGWQGLFGYVENGTIKNLTVKGTVSGKGYVGGIVGYFDVGTVEKCSFEGAVKGGSSGQPIGGIAGYNRSGTITKCSNRGEVSCLSEYAGGIVGQNYGTNAKVTDCENTGTISLIDSTGKGSTVGGIVGINVSGGKIINCNNTGTIGAENNLIVGGIVGKNNGGSVTQCYNTGIVIGKDYIGGVAGQSIAQATITECYNTGAVSGSNYIGGAVGQNDDGSTIMSCYNTATVTGSSNVGGLVGKNCGGSSKQPTLGTVKHCYNRGTVTGNNSGGVVGINKINNSEGKVENCYYLTNTAAGGINKADTVGATVKTEAAFNSGEVTWLLQRSQTTQVWGQWLNGNGHEIEKYPVLTDQLPKRVWKASFIKNGANIYDAYVNNGGTVTPPTGDAWFESNGARFNSTVQITEDKILGLSVRFGGTDDNEIATTYGKRAEKNLDEWMGYENGSPVQDRFTYTIKDNGGIANASIDGNMLVIPAGVTVKEGGYTLKIIAHEKTPMVDVGTSVTTLSVNRFDNEDVELTVKVIINKAVQESFAITGMPAGVTYGDSFRLGTAGGSGTGAVTWKVTEGAEYATVDQSGNVTVNGVGERVTVTATKAGDDNYLQVTATVTFPILKANQSALNITEVPSSVGYGDTFRLNTTGGLDGAAVVWAVIAGENYAEIDGDGNVRIIGLGADGLGEITVRATKTGGANYNDAVDEVTFIAHKANQTAFTIKSIPSSIGYGDDGIQFETEGGLEGATVVWDVKVGKEYLEIDGNGNLTIKGACKSVTVTATKLGGNFYFDASDEITFEIHKANQVDFTITDVPSSVAYNDTFTLGTNGGSGTGAVTWEVTGNATVVGGYVTVTGIGVVTITATKAEDGNYYSDSDTVTFTVNPAYQDALTIGGLPQLITYGDKNIELSVTGGSSGGAVTWTVTEGSNLVVDLGNGTYKIAGAGEVTVTATMSGGVNYYDVSDSISFTIHKANQTDFTITNIPSVVVYGDTVTLGTDGGSGTGAVTWEVTEGQNLVEKSGEGIYKIIGVGTVTITATKAEDDNYYSDSDTVSFTVNPAYQSVLTIGGLPQLITYGDGDIELSVTGGSSGGAVTWTVTEGSNLVVDLGNGTYKIVGAGEVTVTATMSGGDNYYDVSDTISFTIHKANQVDFTIKDVPSSVAYGDTFTLGTDGGSGTGAVTWEVTGNATVVGGYVTVTGMGVVTITATKAEDDNFNADSDTVSFTVQKANQETLTIKGLPADDELITNATFTLQAEGGSGTGKITWAVTEGNADAEIDEFGKVTVRGASNGVTITATKAGDDNYNSAVAIINFQVGKAGQPQLTITDVPSSVGYGDKIQLNAVGGLESISVTWEVIEGSSLVEDLGNGKYNIIGVGTVTVKATKFGGDDYYDVYDMVTLAVHKANQAAFYITKTPSSVAYNDGFTLETEGGSGTGAVTWEVTGNATVTNGYVTVTGMGEVTITATKSGGANYNDVSATFTFTVQKANQQPLNILGLPAAVTYGDLLTLAAEGGTGDGEITWIVTAGKNLVDDKGNGNYEVIGVGEVTITVTMSGGDYYYDISTSVSFTAVKANQASFYITEVPSSVSYNDEFTLQAEGGSGTGAVTWDVTGNATVVVGGKVTVTGMGEVTVTATKSGGANYNDVYATFTFTVQKANQQALNIVGLPTAVAYGDKIELSAEGGTGDGEITWTVTTGANLVEYKGNGNYGVIGVGDVTITATKSGGDYYCDISTSVSFTAVKANQTDFTITDLPSSVAYKDEFTLTTKGGLEGGAVTWNYSGAATVVDGKVTVTGVGDVTITATKSGGDFYNDIVATVSFTTVKANQDALTIGGVPAAAAYGEEFELTVSGSSSGEPVVWEVITEDGATANAQFAERGKLKITGVGEITVRATVSGGANYNDISATVGFTAVKANQTPLVIEGLPSALTVDDEPFTLRANGGSNDGGRVIWEIVDGAACVKINESTGEVTVLHAGEVTIKATKIGGNNYYDVSTVVSFTVYKANQRSFAVSEAPADLVYGAKEFKLDTLGGSGDGTIEWEIVEGANCVTVKQDGTVQIIGVGNVTLRAIKRGGNDYYDTVALISFTVGKANPKYKIPENLVARYGDTLADVKLPAGWVWVDDSLSVGVAGMLHGFTATYLPENAEFYNTVTLILSVTVKKATPVFVIPQGLKAKLGATLADVELPEGWTWAQSLNTEFTEVGENTFYAVFTPSDTDNYETVTVALKITVEKEQNGLSYWWIILIVLAVVLLILLIIFLLTRRKDDKSERADRK